jgi:serine/threonine protein kinase
MTALPHWPDTLLSRYEPLEVLQTGDPDYLYLAKSQTGDHQALVILFRKSMIGEHHLDLLAANQKIVEGVRHPRLLLPQESGEFENLLFLIFPAPEGKSLEELLQRKPLLSPQETIHLCRSLLEGLEFLHERNLVHGCLSPERIFQSGSESWTLLDSSSEQALGTGLPLRHLRSPAQVLNQGVDPRDDLFQLGLLAYLVLTGHRPYEGIKEEEFANACTLPVQPTLKESRPFLPESLASWVNQLLEPKRENRPESASVALASLIELRSAPDLAPEPTFTPPPESSQKPTQLESQEVAPRPILPPALPSSPGEKVRWWHVAMLILLAELSTANFFRGLGHPPTPTPAHVPLRPLPGLSQGLKRQPPKQVAPRPVPFAANSEKQDPSSISETRIAEDLPSSPFGPDYVQALRLELEAAKSWQISPQGEVLSSPEAGLEEEAFLDPDPLQARRILEGLPKVVEFHQWIAARHHPESLPRPHRLALRELDLHFQALGLPRPFHPTLYLSPSRRALSPSEAWRQLTGHESPGLAPGRFFSGWFVSFVQEARQALKILHQKETRARQADSEDPWIATVHRLGNREGRLELAAKLKEGRLHWRQALQAGIWSLETQPALQETLTQLLADLLPRTRALAALHLLRNSPTELLPGKITPQLALPLARLTRIHREVLGLTKVEQDVEASQARELALWQEAATREGWSPLKLRRQQIATQESLRLLFEIQDIPAIRDHWLEIQDRLTGFEERLQANLLAELLEFMEQNASTLYLEEADLQHLLQRARYLAPMLPRRERRTLQRNVQAIEEL